MQSRFHSNRRRPLPDPDNEPDFYSMPPCYEITDEDEKKELDALLCGTDRPPSSDTTRYAKRPPPASDLQFSQEVPTKAVRMEIDNEQEGAVSRRSLASRVAEDCNTDGARQSAGQRRSSLSNLASSSDRFGLSSRVSDVTMIHGRDQGELRRHSLSLQASLRDLPGRFPDSMGFLHSGGERFAADDVSAPRSLSSREILLQELLACARSGGEVGPLGVRGGVSGDASLRSEIDILEQTRRNIVLQQQRLQMLMDQAQAASSTRHLAQLAAAYDTGSGLGGLRELGPGLDDLERLATEIAGRAVTSRGLDRRASIGGLEVGGGARGGESIVDAASGSTDPNNMSVSAVFNALANMVASGRFTNAQLDEIEALLHSGRSIAAAAERKHPFDRNQWI